MKMLIPLILCNALIAVYALPTQTSRDTIEQTLKTRLLGALCALRGKVTEKCLNDVRMQKAIQKLMDTTMPDGKLRDSSSTEEGVTSNFLGHLISQKHRRQSSFYSNW